MKKRDARTLKVEAQQELRYQIIRLRKKGIPNHEVAKMVEMSKESTSRIWAMYKRGGMKAIVLKQRGRKDGDKKTLTPTQEAQIIKRLIDTTPKQLKFKYVLWTREAVQKLIKHEFGEEMPISTVGKYLQRWSLPHKYLSKEHMKEMILK